MTTKLSDLRVQEGTGGPFGVHSHLPGYRPAEVSDLVEALQAEGYAVMERARVRYCPFCGRLVERENPDDEMCLPTNCDAWTYTRRFNHETREWEPVVPLGDASLSDAGEGYKPHGVNVGEDA